MKMKDIPDNILKIGDSRLRLQSVDAEDTPETVNIIREMLETIDACEPGSVAGLAAPQIGYNKNIIVVYINKKRTIMINPIVLSTSYELDTKLEACLSVPGESGSVTRPVAIELVYLTPEFESVIVHLYGWNARVVLHECLPNSSLIQTDIGLKTIKWLVDNKYSGKVLSFNEDTSTFEYRNITGHSKQPNKNKKKWVKIKFSATGANKQLSCTEDHKVAYIEDILNPVIKYKDAKSLTGCYVIRPINIERARNKEKPLYNQEQIEVIIGSLFGDSSISYDGQLTSVYSDKKFLYSEYRKDILGGASKPSMSGYRNTYTNISVNHPITEQTKKLHNLFYNNGKRTVKNLLHLITPKGLAFWYMDDGSLNISKRVSTLHTEGFSLEDNKLIVQYFKDAFGISSKILKRKDKELYYISFDVKNTEKLHILISPYIHVSMEYKILPGIFINWGKINNNPLGYSAKLVKNVTHLDKLESALYDLTVDGNHNFVADNTLVHNCDHLYGILYTDLVEQI